MNNIQEQDQLNIHRIKTCNIVIKLHNRGKVNKEPLHIFVATEQIKRHVHLEQTSQSQSFQVKARKTQILSVFIIQNK